MATSAISSSPSTASAPTSITPPTKKFLDRCVEDLSNADTSIKNLERKAFWYKVAGITMIVAFIALAIGAFIATGIYTPIYMPIAGFMAMFFAQYCSSFSAKLFETASVAKLEASKFKECQRHYHTLNSMEPQALQEIFLKHVPQNTNPSSKDLKPLLALAMYLDERIEECNKAKKEKILEANAPAPETPEANRAKIHAHRQEALKIQDNLLYLKVNAAFVNAAMQNPDRVETKEDLVTITPLTSEERCLEQAVHSPSIELPLLTFKNGSTMTATEVLAMDIHTLGTRFLSVL